MNINYTKIVDCYLLNIMAPQSKERGVWPILNYLKQNKKAYYIILHKEKSNTMDKYDLTSTSFVYTLLQMSNYGASPSSIYYFRKTSILEDENIVKKIWLCYDIINYLYK